MQPHTSAGPNHAYSVKKTRVGAFEIVRLADAGREMQVTLAPAIGNIAYEFMVHGKNTLWFPCSGPEELQATQKLCGIPFLSPWANRMDGDTYWVNGKRYLLNPELGYLRRDSNHRPIHGLLLFSPAWTLVGAAADESSAHAACRLEFWRHPEMMAQFPFAHELTLTHRLTGGSLEVETKVVNLSLEPMPVALGFHPYFQLHDAPRDDWHVRIAAREQVELDAFLVATGKRRPVEFGNSRSLRAWQLDDAFTSLIRDADGRARFHVAGKRQRITVSYGPKYTVAVIYAPQGGDFICFEPMAAVTNAFNLAQTGRYAELQTIAPGCEWRESFWITPEGFSSTAGPGS